EIKANTEVNAIALGLGLTAKYLGLEAAGGYGQAKGDAEAIIGGTSTITASDSVSVTAKGKVSAKTTARASSNLIGNERFPALSVLGAGNVNPNNVAIAVAIADSEITVLTNVGNQVSITSTAGNVNILSDATNGAKTDASTFSPIDGLAGVGVALNFEKSN